MSSSRSPDDELRSKIERFAAAGYSATAAHALVIGKADAPVAILAWQPGENGTAVVFADDAFPSFAFPDADAAVQSLLNVGVVRIYVDPDAVN